MIIHYGKALILAPRILVALADFLVPFGIQMDHSIILEQIAVGGVRHRLLVLCRGSVKLIIIAVEPMFLFLPTDLVFQCVVFEIEYF